MKSTGDFKIPAQEWDAWTHSRRATEKPDARVGRMGPQSAGDGKTTKDYLRRILVGCAFVIRSRFNAYRKRIWAMMDGAP